METLRSHNPTDWREGRRLRALELHLLGEKQQSIAQALGVTQGALSHRLACANKDGP